MEMLYTTSNGNDNGPYDWTPSELNVPDLIDVPEYAATGWGPSRAASADFSPENYSVENGTSESSRSSQSSTPPTARSRLHSQKHNAFPFHARSFLFRPWQYSDKDTKGLWCTFGALCSCLWTHTTEQAAPSQEERAQREQLVRNIFASVERVGEWVAVRCRDQCRDQCEANLPCTALSIISPCSWALAAL